MNQAEMIAENAQVENDEFINIFYTPVQDKGETSSCHVDSSNMHTFYQHHPSEHRWTKDHPLEQVIRNPSQSVRTRRQLESDGEMCMFALTMSRTEPKNIKEAMVDSAWIKSMQEELHQFDRLDNTIIRNKSRLVAKGYAQKILIKHGMTSCDSIGTPMDTKHLDADLSGTPVDQTKYRSMVGALMYLTASRPDIMHATCYCARYQEKPTEKHHTTLNGSFGTLKIPFTWDSGGDKLVSWSSKKQDCTSMSSAKAKYHFIKEKVEKGIVELFFVGTEYQLADMFTKALPEEKFKYLVRRLGMRCLTPEELEVLANESA
nr:hypothetical protein [Tanacetum cinerariifolium]